MRHGMVDRDLKYYGPYKFSEPRNFTVIPKVTSACVIDMRAIEFERLTIPDISNVKTLDITDPNNNNIFFYVVLYRGRIQSSILTNGEIYFPVNNIANALSLTLLDRQLIMDVVGETISELF